MTAGAVTRTRSRIPTPEARRRIILATEALLQEDGAAALSVSSISSRAGVNRTVFYRHFASAVDVVATLVERIANEQARNTAAWFSDPMATGSREVTYENALQGARAILPHIELVCAIADAAAGDDALRQLWHDRFVQRRIDNTAAAIRRDQAQGAIRVTLDADAAALALQTMSISLGLEMLGRERREPEEYARVVAPVWEAVLFEASPCEHEAPGRTEYEAPARSDVATELRPYA